MRLLPALLPGALRYARAEPLEMQRLLVAALIEHRDELELADRVFVIREVTSALAEGAPLDPSLWWPVVAAMR